MRFIYDLDHTVIDSTHRAATLPNGSLDLAHWREHSTPELIAKDKLLPLAGHWKIQRARGAEIVVCTARVMGDADYQYLADHGLIWDGMDLPNRRRSNIRCDSKRARVASICRRCWHIVGAIYSLFCHAR